MKLWTSLVAKVGKVAAWIIVGAVALAVLYALAEVKSCRDSAGITEQAKINGGQLGAFQNSAVDANNTISGVTANQAAGVELGRQNEEEIRHAKGSDQPVDPAANAAGLHALCRRASHAHDPACRVQQPHTP
jgi:hypothetical protein